MPKGLRPCPFCGGENVAIHRTPTGECHMSYYAVLCKNPDCQAEGPWDLGESGAIEKWNERCQLHESKVLLETLELARSTLNSVANPPSYRIKWAAEALDKALALLKEAKNAPGT